MIPRLKNAQKNKINDWLKILLMFCLSLPIGGVLGGNLLYFGTEIPYSQVLFPLFGVFALLFFLANAFLAPNKLDPTKKLIPRLLLLLLIGISGVIGTNSAQSFLFLILWASGVVLMSSGKSWNITNGMIWALIFVILGYSGVQVFGFDVNLPHAGLISAFSVLGLAYNARNPNTKYMGIINLLMLWGIMLSKSLLLLALGIAVLAIVPVIRKKYFRQTYPKQKVFIPLVFGFLVFFYWLFFAFGFPTSPYFFLPTDFLRSFIGFGTGNILLGQQIVAGLPAEALNLAFPSTGVGFLISELGILGFFALITLLFIETKDDKLRFALVLTLLIILPDFYTEEAGIILLLGFFTLNIRPKSNERVPAGQERTHVRSVPASRLAVAAQPK